MTETITGPNTTTVQGNKASKYIVSISISAAAAGAITVGTGDKFGLPMAAPSANYVIAKWADTLALDAGTFVAADATTATATTGDVRGTYVPSSASNGTRRLTVYQLAYDVDTVVGVLGVTQA